MKARQRNLNGFSLLYALVGVVGVGLVAILLGKLLTLQLAPQRRIELKADRAAIARHVSERLSCTTTMGTIVPAQFPNLTAANGQLVNVYDRLGNLLISANPAAPTRYGTFTLRAVARTVTAPLGIEVQVARPSAGNLSPLSDAMPDDQFERDPMLTALPQSWAAPASRLFAAGAYPCAAEFSGGCVHSCPVGTVVVSVDSATQCVTCADMTCPAGQAFQGHDVAFNKICVAADAPCPANQIRVGSVCVDAATKMTNEYITSTSLQCRVVENLNPQIQQNRVQCDPNTEFVAHVGGNCVTQTGQQLFGAQPGGGPLRYPGYVNRSFPLSTSSQEFNCYHFREDSLQGRQVVRGICCKLKAVVN